MVGAAWVGDAILSQPLLALLRRHAGAGRLDVLAPRWTHGVLQRMPEVDQIIDLPFAHGELNLRARWRLGRSLRSAAYDQALVLPNSLKSALIPWFAGIPRRTGYIGEQRRGLLNDARRLDRESHPLMVQRFLALGDPENPMSAAPPQPRLRVNTEHQARLLESLGLNRERPIAIFCPGAEYGPAKRWPVAHFAAVGRRWIEDGWQIWVMGSARDRDVGASLIDQLGPSFRHLLCGATGLEDAVDLMALGQRVVTNDSGLMHMAAALDRPTVAIFGSSSPQFTPPLSAAAHVVRLDLPCSPCFERTCPLGHLRCLTELTPEVVMAHFSTRLHEPAGS